MKANDRARLTAALREHVGRIAADLRAKMLTPGSVRERALQLHADERVAEDFDVWTDLLSRRAAVLWVLKSVYVRVLEDRGLLNPGRLLDLEAQQLFERLAPHLGETAFLRWIYRDLASQHGGLPELFSSQPAEVAAPSDELSRSLIAFWRHRDADTGALWSFAEERFEGELMGDLYQELDPVVKDRFALCQTPDFVRAFILDRTLTPAIETFRADEVRLLDPACGSGHFLIDGLKRLVGATAAIHGDWDRAKVVAHALDRVVGVDLNDYACALARTRLIMTAAELAGVTTLADAARFHPHVYWADGLEQVERDEAKSAVQFGLFEKVEDKPRATLTRSDVRTALKKVIATKFHAVVANPPYITEKDAARKDYHREKVGKKQRYVSAYREYSLGSPFTERCFQLAEKGGYVGIITSNNFMKREFGKPLVEKVLATCALTLVVDASQAYIPFHGTPTALLFARNHRPANTPVNAVMSKRGEDGTPEDPAKGRVWSSIEEGWNQVGFENDYVSVSALPRETLNQHPWSLGGGGAAELKAQLERAAITRLGAGNDIGVVCITRADDIYVGDEATFRRAGIPAQFLRPFILGNRLRDWSVNDPDSAVFPYDAELKPVDAATAPAVHRFLWPYRSHLWERREPNGNHRQIGLTWWEWSRLIRRRLESSTSLAFAKVATHNHFVIDRGGSMFSDGSPVVKLPLGAADQDHFALLGLLNSSSACFWMKQVFHNKGGGTDSGKMQSDPAKVAHEFTATGLEQMPIPDLGSTRLPIARLAKAVDALAIERAGVLSDVLPRGDALTPVHVAALVAGIESAREQENVLLQRQVVLQEEIDWLVYKAFGLLEDPTAEDLFLPERLFASCGVPIGARPFEIIQARSGRERGVDSQQLVAQLREDTDPAMAKVWDARVSAIKNSHRLSLIEHERYKRRWLLTPKHLAGRVETFDDRLSARLGRLLAELVESTAQKRTSAFDVGRVAADLQADPRFDMLVQVATSRRDYSLDQTVREILSNESVPNHPVHRYSPSGLVKYRAWEETWGQQRQEDVGQEVSVSLPPTYAQPDFASRRVFELRGKLDVPRERFVAFTEVPGRAGAETLYGWAGWTPVQRLKTILAIDEGLEDSGVPLADRIGLLDSAWRLLPDVAREDAAAATRLRAELQALVGPEGPSRELVRDWTERFPPRKAKATRTKRAAAARENDEGENEESDES